MTQNFVQTGLEIQQLSRAVEARHHRLEWILFVEKAVFVWSNDSIGRKSKVGGHGKRNGPASTGSGRRSGTRTDEIIEYVLETTHATLHHHLLRNIPQRRRKARPTRDQLHGILQSANNGVVGLESAGNLVDLDIAECMVIGKNHRV